MAEPDRDPAAAPGPDLPEPPPGQDLPEPTLRRRRPSLIWFIPLVAAVIGAWMAFKSYTEKSPTITITFQSAEGLEAGQTRIKHKDVEVGRVTAIRLSPDFSRVVVTAELTREAYALLSENSRFWVVRARISSNGISGLGTLLSGAYIGMDPGAPRARCSGISRGSRPPPSCYPHHARRAGGTAGREAGLPERRLPGDLPADPVGEVEGFDLDPGGQSVLIKVQINAPYHKLVHRDTRFWDAAGWT